MSFESWLNDTKNKPLFRHGLYRKQYVAKEAYRAAINEAIQVVDDSVSKSCVGIVAKLKELK